MNSLLSIKNGSVFYGPIEALKKINLDLEEGTITAIIGANGAGKSSLIHAIAGIQPLQGELFFREKKIHYLSLEERAKLGISLVSEGRNIFRNLTILENLKLAAWKLPINTTRSFNERYAEIKDFFPLIKERENQLVGTLSGGEQQLLALAKAFITQPKLLLLDEPSMGLSPFFAKRIFELIKLIHHKGISILLVEQNARLALKLATKASVLELGKFVFSGSADEILDHPAILRAYLT